MFIQNLHCQQFKIIKEAFLSFSPHINVFVGNNGYGKTSLLEALHTIVSAHSFYKTKDSNLISTDESHYFLESKIIKPHSFYQVATSFDLETHKKSYTVDQKKIPHYKTLLELFPVVYFTPFDIEVVRGTPQIRRQFFDRVISYFNGNYYESLKQYNKLLKEKNTLLRKREYDLLEFWNSKIIPLACFIVKERFRHIQSINEFIKSMPIYSPIMEGLTIEYDGIEDEGEFKKKLEDNLYKEKERKMALYGPHRDSFVFEKISKNLKIRDNLSLGQTKILSFYIKVLEVFLMNQKLKTKPLFLVDDVFSELDSINKNVVRNLLQDLTNQIFITTTKESMISNVFDSQKDFEFINEGQIIS